MIKIHPLPGFVLIEPIEEEEKSVGGVYLPETSKDKPSKGRLVDFTPSWKKVEKAIEPWLKDNKNSRIVIYKKWTNQEIIHEGKTYLLVAFSELLGVIE